MEGGRRIGRGEGGKLTVRKKRESDLDMFRAKRGSSERKEEESSLDKPD